MDALTAGTALVLVQLCVALVMTGTFYAAPSEKCTRYWAVSGVFVAAGVLLAVANAGAPRYLVLMAANNSIILGGILQWCGIRAFFKKPPACHGWIVGGMFFLLFGLLLLQQAPGAHRVLLLSAAVLALLCLHGFEIWTGHGPRRSFARILTLGALAILIIDYSARLIGSLSGLSDLRPTTNSLLSVTLIYYVPIAGTLLLSTGLLLLYFERIVADKHHLATHDDVTGVLNRRAVTSAGERELAVAARMGQPVVVAFVDIDHFKQINDRLGHEAGDRVIAEVAHVLKETCRSIDLVGRYGGDEFCIICPGTSRASALIVGERLVQAVRQHQFKDNQPVTVSVGLAAFSSGSIERTWAHLVRRADEELYKVKASGRNTFSVASNARPKASRYVAHSLEHG